MRGLAPLVLLLPMACAAPLRLLPHAPARPSSCDEPAPGALRVLLERPLPSEHVAALFPELHLDTRLVDRVRLQSREIYACEGRLVLEDPSLTLLNRRGEVLDVGLCTPILVGWGAALALRREEIRVEIPQGAWIASDRVTLRRVGRVEVGAIASGRP